MKTIEEIKDIKKNFIEEYRPAFLAVDNNLAVGIGQESGEYTLEVRLANNKFRSTIPDEYEGVKVNTVVVENIQPL